MRLQLDQRSAGSWLRTAAGAHIERLAPARVNLYRFQAPATAKCRATSPLHAHARPAGSSGGASAAPDCFRSPQPAARKLGRFFTPQGKGKGGSATAAAGPAAPATPGADARAATDSHACDVFCPDGPAGEESLLSPEADPIPPQLAALRDLLGKNWSPNPRFGAAPAQLPRQRLVLVGS